VLTSTWRTISFEKAISQTKGILPGVKQFKDLGIGSGRPNAVRMK
jgi:hypothetical protein